MDFWLWKMLIDGHIMAATPFNVYNRFAQEFGIDHKMLRNSLFIGLYLVVKTENGILKRKQKKNDKQSNPETIV